MATYGHRGPPSLQTMMNRCAAGGSCTGSPGWRRRRRWTTSSATTWSAGGWNPAPGLDQRRAWHSAMTGSLDTWGPSRRCRGPVRLPADVTSRRRAICPRTKIRLDARADLRRPGSWSSATVPVAGWGAREGVGAHKSPRECVLGGLPPSRRPWAGPGVVTTLRGHGAGVGPASSSSGGLSGSAGAACGRNAAAVREKRCPLGATSAMASKNSGGRDRV